MRRLGSFTFITLNGCFEGPKGDISWHRHGSEEAEYAAEQMKTGSVLLFGRVTYAMMAQYWPTPMAMQNSPDVARGMNAAEKLVFSRTLRETTWSNSRILRDNIVEEVRAIKQSPGRDLTILGSGSIVKLFTEHGLIDEYYIMLDPVAIGAGTMLFSGIGEKLDLRLKMTRTFTSGVILLHYEPLRQKSS